MGEFKWKGRVLHTIGDIMDVVTAIKSREEAQAFMRAYVEDSPMHARGNIGYAVGYHDAKTAERIWDWFECVHPILGRRPDSWSGEELFKLGMRMGEKSKKRAATDLEEQLKGARAVMEAFKKEFGRGG